MKLIIENWRNFKNEQSFRGPTDDPSFSDPGYNEPEDFTPLSDEITAMLDKAAREGPVTLPTGKVLSYNGAGDQFILDGEVFANGYNEAEDLLYTELEGLEEQISQLVYEEIQRMIDQGLIDEGLMDFAKNIGSKAKMGMAGLGMMAAAGAVPSTAQAEISPSPAAAQITQVMNKKMNKLGLKDPHTLDVKVFDSDAGVLKLANAVSNLTKTVGTSTKGDKDIVNMVTNTVIKIADKIGDDQKTTNNMSINSAADIISDKIDDIAAQKAKAAESELVVSKDGKSAVSKTGFSKINGVSSRLRAKQERVADLKAKAEKTLGGEVNFKMQGGKAVFTRK